jgi:hypothetical protein
MQKNRVFADTNVILEAFRIDCWESISDHFHIETVEKCIEETLTGNPNSPRHISVNSTKLKTGLNARHQVYPATLASLVLSHPICANLDDGEQHLLAWLFENKPSLSKFIVTTADKAALRAVHQLGFLDNALSLEDLARQASVTRNKLNGLALQHKDEWLSQFKTKLRLETMH